MSICRAEDAFYTFVGAYQLMLDMPSMDGLNFGFHCGHPASLWREAGCNEK